MAGSNAPKTAVVILEPTDRRQTKIQDPKTAPLNLSKVYEKIGSFGNLFSDDRLLDILTLEAPLATIFLDCPLSAPPCVECQRPVCPGVMRCADVSVAYMMALAAQQKRAGARRVRPLNPQSQRLWDVIQVFSQDKELGEPTFSANQAPLVIRARTLQKRLNAMATPVVLRETQVPGSLAALAPLLRLPIDIRRDYRNFERGRATRIQIFDALVSTRMLGTQGPSAAEVARMRDLCVTSVEVFQALIAALVASLYTRRLTSMPPPAFVTNETGDGWVYLPEFNPSPPSQ